MRNVCYYVVKVIYGITLKMTKQSFVLKHKPEVQM